MEHTSTSKRILSWGIFIVIIGLVVWGLVAAQKKAARDEANLVLPSQIAADDHARGSTIAPVTLVEYGDFQCPACGTYYPLVEQLVEELGPDKLRMVFRHFPLTQSHPNALSAAKAAEAAALQGKFWEMYNMLYERQKTWSDSKDAKTIFTSYAKEMGLDTEKFVADFELKSVSDKINNDYKGGSKGGIQGTPTFFVNGKQIASPSSYDEFKKIITDAATTTTVSQ